METTTLQFQFKDIQIKGENGFIFDIPKLPDFSKEFSIEEIENEAESVEATQIIVLPNGMTLKITLSVQELAPPVNAVATGDEDDLPDAISIILGLDSTKTPGVFQFMGDGDEFEFELGKITAT